MSATTVTIPTLAWALPLTLLACLAHAWAWRRYVVPVVRRRVIEFTRRRLVDAGLNPEEVDAGIEEWKAEGWLG